MTAQHQAAGRKGGQRRWSTDPGIEIPPGALSPALTRVVLATIEVYQRDGRATVRTIAAQADRSLAPTQHQIERAIGRGLLTAESGRHGTLRPAYGLVNLMSEPHG